MLKSQLDHLLELKCDKITDLNSEILGLQESLSENQDKIASLKEDVRARTRTIVILKEMLANNEGYIKRVLDAETPFTIKTIQEPKAPEPVYYDRVIEKGPDMRRIGRMESQHNLAQRQENKIREPWEI